MRVRNLFAIAAASAALSLAACGGDDEADGGALPDDEYVERTEETLQTIVSLDELSAPLAEPESEEQYADGVRRIVAELDATVADLEAIEPPESVASAHDKLIAAVAAFGAAFEPLADAAEAQDQEGLQTGVLELQAAETAFGAAISEVDKQFEAEDIEIPALN